jgi:uncharacterized membrane protein YqjE
MVGLIYTLEINMKIACSGKEIGSIIVNKNSTINVWFNNFMRSKYNVELKDSDIKIMIDSLIIYSYYDQSIGNLLFNEINLFSDNKNINVSLLFSSFIYISNILQENPEGKLIHTESYQKLNYCKQLKINELLHTLHSENSEVDINELYDNIIITKFIFIILLKKNHKFNYLLDKQLEKQFNDKFRNDREMIDILLSPEELSNDREIVKIAVSQTGYTLRFASIELMADREIVKHAVLQDGLSLYFASNELRNDREIVQLAVSINGFALEFASIELSNDKEIVKLAVLHTGYALQFASQKLRNDKEIVKIAVLQMGDALKYASLKLRNDREILKITGM